eukprot:scaffold272518_cov30-Tisochrysis_lutea.AAC.3
MRSHWFSTTDWLQHRAMERPRHEEGLIRSRVQSDEWRSSTQDGARSVLTVISCECRPTAAPSCLLLGLVESALSSTPAWWNGDVNGDEIHRGRSDKKVRA